MKFTLNLHLKLFNSVIGDFSYAWNTCVCVYIHICVCMYIYIYSVLYESIYIYVCI